jgi:hypothetical protein
MGFGFLLALFGLGAALSFSGSLFSQSESDPATSEAQQDNESTDTAPISEGALNQVFAAPPAADALPDQEVTTTTAPEPNVANSDADLFCDDPSQPAVTPGPLLTATEAPDTFVVSVPSVSEAGNLLDADGQPVGHTVIANFNPDDDQLVLDLSGSNLVPENGAPVVLTGVVPPDGEGLMIQVDGVNVVQLSTYGGGNAQWALEDLYTDFAALEVTGADFVFPDDSDDSPVVPPVATPIDPVDLPGTLIGPGLSLGPSFADDINFFMSAEYSGADYFPAGDGFDTLNLTLHALDLNVTVDASGVMVVTSPQNATLAPTFTGIDLLILGDGTNSFDASEATGTHSVLSYGGENTLIGGGGTNFLTSLGGNALIQGGSGINYITAANGNDTIIGGTGTNIISSFNDGFVGVNAPDGSPIWLPSVSGFTTINDGPGDDQIFAGRGDQITLTSGANQLDITGYSPDDFGPALVFGFDPQTDSFVYRVAISEQEPDYGMENPAPRDVTLEQRGSDVVLLQSGVEMVRFADLTLAEIDAMQDGRFVQQGDPNMGMFR